MADREVWYSNGSTHNCVTCNLPIINLFTDEACTIRVEGDEKCWPCEEFGGPVDDMPELWSC